MRQFEKYKPGLINLCKENKVIKKLYFFGSVLTPQFNEASSDIDDLL